MLGFVQLAAPAIVVTAATAIACLIVLAAALVFIDPLLDWLTKGDVGFLGRAIRWVAKPAVSQVKAFRRWYFDLLTRTFNGASRPLIILLNQLAALTQDTYVALGDLALETWRGFDVLTTTTLPREINRVTAPIRNTVQRHTERLATLESLNRQVAGIIGDGLRALPWGVPGTYVGNVQAWWNTYERLWTQVFTFVTPQLNTLRNETVPQLARQLERLTTRLDTFTEQGLDTIVRRVETLEERVQRVIEPQLEIVMQSVDTLFGMVSGQVTDTLTTLFQRVTDLETQLEQLAGSAVTALAQRVTDLETQLRDDLLPRIRQLETKVELLLEQTFGELTADLSALVRRIDDLETQLETVVLPRITALEALLAPAAFAAAVAVAMRTIAPNLFCRNVTTITQRACATDENFLAELLAGTLLFALALDPRVIARAGQELTGGMAALWRETALR